MNIEDLDELSPEMVKTAEEYVSKMDDSLLYSSRYRASWESFCCINADVIVAALHAGLRLKRELEGMTRE